MAELRRADVLFATCVSARRGSLSSALQVLSSLLEPLSQGQGAPELLQVVLDEALFDLESKPKQVLLAQSEARPSPPS